jgi:uncharacterized protein (DUF433 family)
MKAGKKKRKLLGRYIVADPEICHGKPTFIGSRVMVWQVLEAVDHGRSYDEITTALWPGSVCQEAIAEAVALDKHDDSLRRRTSAKHEE